MKVENNLDYNNKAQLEIEITELLYKLYYEGLDKDVYNGLETFRNELYLAREKYDKARFPQTKKKRKNKLG